MTVQLAIKVLFARREVVFVLAGLHGIHPFPQLCGCFHQHHFIGADATILTALLLVRCGVIVFPLNNFPTLVFVAIYIARGHPSDAPTIAGRTVFDRFWDVKHVERITLINDFQFTGCLDDVIHLLQLLRRLIQATTLKPRNHPKQVNPAHVVAQLACLWLAFEDVTMPADRTGMTVLRLSRCPIQGAFDVCRIVGSFGFFLRFVGGVGLRLHR